MTALDDEARATLRRWTRDGLLWIAAGLASAAITGIAIWQASKASSDADDWNDALAVFPFFALAGFVVGFTRLRAAARAASLLKRSEWQLANVRSSGSAATGSFDFEISDDNEHWRPLVLPRSDKKLVHATRVAERIEIATPPGSSFVVRPPSSRFLCVVANPSARSRGSITGWPRRAFQIGITIALVLVAALQLGAIDQANEARRRSDVLDQQINAGITESELYAGERWEDPARKSFITFTVAAVVIALLALALNITFVIFVRRRPKHARLSPWTHAWTWLVILGCATAFVATCVTSGASPWRDAASEATNPAIFAAVFALAFVPIVWCAPRRVTTTSGL